MTGLQRREEIVKMLKNTREPMTGKLLSETFSVSRQIIVQDITMIKSSGTNIISTNKGYQIPVMEMTTRVFKVHHLDEEIEDELFTIVDHGGQILDVFIRHKVYGELRAPMNISSRLDVLGFVENIKSGKSTPLKNVTANYHYHTVAAPSEQVLDLIEMELKKKNYLAEFLDYEN